MQIMQQHKLQLLALLIKGPRNREIQTRIKQSIGNVTDYSKRLMYERCAGHTPCGLLSELFRENTTARACSACQKGKSSADLPAVSLTLSALAFRTLAASEEVSRFVKPR